MNGYRKPSIGATAWRTMRRRCSASLKRALGCAAAIIAICAMTITPCAMAAHGSGTISIEARSTDANGTIVSMAGDVWSLSLVATVTIDTNGNRTYSTAAGYEAFSHNDWGTLGDGARRQMAVTLASHASANNLYNESASVTSGGTATFTGLPDGLYLVARTGINPSNQAYEASPTLIDLPNDDGSRNVTAAPKHGWAAQLTLSAENMSSYTGDPLTSAEQSSFPRVRYRVHMNDVLRDMLGTADVSTIAIHTAQGETIHIDDPIGDAGNVLIPELQNLFVYEGRNLSSSTWEELALNGELAQDSSQGGLYAIDVKDSTKLTASFRNQPIGITYQPGILTVRYVARADDVANGERTITTPVLDSQEFAQLASGTQASDDSDTVYDVHRTNTVAGADVVDRTGGFLAVAPTGTTFNANGRGELGSTNAISGMDGRVDIALLSDRLLGNDTTYNYEDKVRARAETYVDGTALAGIIDAQQRSWDFRYLDLVNQADGNVWVTSSAGIDVYWPYPQGTDANTTFTLVHFGNMFREYGIDGEEILDKAIADAPLNTVSVTNTPQGIRFHVDADGFGPFALTWTSNPQTNAGSGSTAGTGAAVAIIVGTGICLFTLGAIIKRRHSDR